MRPSLDNYCVHFNGAISVSENHQLYCRDYAVRVYDSPSRYCMREWGRAENILHSFRGAKKVTQADLNTYAHHFVQLHSLGTLLGALFEKGQKSFLIAFSRHLAVVKFFQNQENIQYQLYDPNHTNQAIEGVSIGKYISKNLNSSVSDAGWKNYANNMDTVCVMTRADSPYRIPVPQFNWSMLGMLLRFEQIDQIRENSSLLKNLQVPADDIEKNFLMPRQVLPHLTESSLLQYFQTLASVASKLSTMQRMTLMGVDAKPTAFDVMKIRYPDKFEFLLERLSNLFSGTI